MIKMQLVIEWGGVLGMKPRDINRTLKNSWALRGQMWHEKFRPRHFTLDAMRRYNYQERSPGYNRRKMNNKRIRIALPLVYSGKSRELGRTRTIEATRNRVDVITPIRAFNFRPKTSGGRAPINMVDEFRRMSPDEIEAMDQRQTQFLERQFNGFQKRSERIGE